MTRWLPLLLSLAAPYIVLARDFFGSERGDATVRSLEAPLWTLSDTLHSCLGSTFTDLWTGMLGDVEVNKGTSIHKGACNKTLGSSVSAWRWLPSGTASIRLDFFIVLPAPLVYGFVTTSPLSVTIGDEHRSKLYRSCFNWRDTSGSHPKDYCDEVLEAPIRKWHEHTIDLTKLNFFTASRLTLIFEVYGTGAAVTTTVKDITFQDCSKSFFLDGGEEMLSKGFGLFTKEEIEPSSAQAGRPIYRNHEGDYLYYWKPDGIWIVGTDYKSPTKMFWALSNAVCPYAATNWNIHNGSAWSTATVVSATIVNDTQADTWIYSCGQDKKIYKQDLMSMSPSSHWEPAGDGPVLSMAVDLDTIYVVSADSKVYKQALSSMSLTSPWTLTGAESVTSIAIARPTIYGVFDEKVVSQVLDEMTPETKWVLAGKGPVLSIALARDSIYSIGVDRKVYKQAISSMTPHSDWLAAGAGEMLSITIDIDGGDIYAVGHDHLVYKQELSSMSPSSKWSLAGSGEMTSIVIAQDTTALGRTCEGRQTEMGACPAQPNCAGPCVDCAFHAWNSWSTPPWKCTGLCHRARDMTHANFCGKPCKEGVTVETKACPDPCLREEDRTSLPSPTDCSLGAWSDWTKCFEDRFSQVHRTREFASEASPRGKPCKKGALTESRACSAPEPHPCRFSAWSTWAGCSAVCDGGRTTRTRYVAKHAERRGAVCKGSVFEERGCNKGPCYNALNCDMAMWSSWSECKLMGKSGTNTSSDLQGGFHMRERSIRKHADRGGAPCRSAVKEIKGCKGATVYDCMLSSWSPWSCSQTCGGGHQTRSRSLPHAFEQASSCPQANLVEVSACSYVECLPEADCKYADWTDWSDCPVTCGQSMLRRTRTVVEVPGGRKCRQGKHDSSFQQSRMCTRPACPLEDCLWLDWSSWGACSESCGGGTAKRHRKVSSVPHNGGTCSPHSLAESRKCHSEPCECTDGKWGQWSGWGLCSATCGDGYKKRSRRTVSSPNHCGKPAVGRKDDFQRCSMSSAECKKYPDVDCELSVWSSWSTCSSTCTGVHSRKRSVLHYAHGKGTSCAPAGRVLQEMRQCAQAHDARCEGYLKPSADCQEGDWTVYSPCTVSCGGGAVVRSRSLTPPQHHGKACTGPVMKVEVCNTKPCPKTHCVDCRWGQWSEWNACISCTGQKTRSRQMEEPGNYCGLPCKETIAEEAVNCHCDHKYCAWSQWSSFSACPKSCGLHVIQRVRHLGWTTNRTSEFLVAAKAGSKLPCSAPQEDVHFCRTGCKDKNESLLPSCHPVDCEGYLAMWGLWEPYGAGVKLCKRTRGNASDIEANIVNECCKAWTFPMTETKLCGVDKEPKHKEKPVPVDCLIGAWGDWSDSGDKCYVNKTQIKHLSRAREVYRMAAHGGQPCMADLEEAKPCDPHYFAHPVDCNVSSWSHWSTCDVTCGTGQRMRHRQVDAYPLGGGKICPERLSLSEMAECGTKNPPCSAHTNCTLSSWREWTPCTMTCGIGQSTRKREIATLLNYVSGTTCKLGTSLGQVRPCPDIPPCTEMTPTCAWSAWTDWSECSRDCKGEKTRNSWVTPRKTDAGNCPTKGREENKLCNSDCDDCGPGLWSDWSTWSSCTATCNDGYSWRSRKVTREAKECGKPLEGLSQDVARCNVDTPCIPDVDCKFSQWLDWSSCSSTCNGVKERSRLIANYSSGAGTVCAGPLSESSPCSSNSIACDQVPATKHGHSIACFGDWTPFSMCSASCGGGQAQRTRNLIGDENCQGALHETHSCSTQLCDDWHKAIDCVWQDWSSWGECDKCGGLRHRSRKILSDGGYGGKPCEPHGAEDVARCPKLCPGRTIPQTMCVWAEWDSWSPCAVSCGPGSRSRSRSLRLTHRSASESGHLRDDSQLEVKVKELYLLNRHVEERYVQHVSLSFVSGAALSCLVMLVNYRWDIFSRVSARRVFLI